MIQKKTDNLKHGNTRVLTPTAIEKIKRLIILGESFSTIAKTVRTQKMTITHKDVDKVFYNMIRNPIKKPSITINTVKKCYYENEQAIFDELNKEYKAEDLTGWEKQQLEKLEADQKLKESNIINQHKQGFYV
jgi:hypothetical protein